MYFMPRYDSDSRRSQSLSNQNCQTILFKTVFEHFTELRNVAALLVASKSFQNSTFGANFVVNFKIVKHSAQMLNAVLSPSSCLSVQFVPSICIDNMDAFPGEVDPGILKYIAELVRTKYLALQLQLLSLETVPAQVVDAFFAGPEATSWPQLRSLKLERSKFDGKAFLAIAKSASYLTSLSLSCTPYEFDGTQLEHIGSLANLTAIDFSGCEKITDAALLPISECPSIRDLNLFRCKKITDVTLAAVAALSGLTRLNLSMCEEITDVGMAHISTLSGMTSLDLHFCHRVSDLGLQHLSKLTQMTALWLVYMMKITDNGLESISCLSRITTLHLDADSSFTDAGLAHIAKKLSSITELSLKSCGQIGTSGLEHVSKLSNITSVDLSWVDGANDGGLEHVAKLANLSRLSLGGCHAITDAGLAHLTRLTKITFLEISACTKVTDVGLQGLSKLTSLTTLIANACTQITDVGLHYLVNLENLTELGLFRLDLITSEGLEKFSLFLPLCKIRR